MHSHLRQYIGTVHHSPIKISHICSTDLPYVLRASWKLIGYRSRSAVYIAGQDVGTRIVLTAPAGLPSFVIFSLGSNSIAKDGLRRDDAVVVLESQSCAQLGSGPDRYTSQYNGTRLARHPTRLVRGYADLINLMKRLQQIMKTCG